MEKRSETQLPEAIIQHVQSFLSAKEAAQTTILSKSWYTAWLTRPNLDFDELNFPGQVFETSSNSAFVKFVKKTMQRYEDLNRKIQSFRLQMRETSSGISLANRMIAKAMTLGATDFNIEFMGGWRHFALPKEVLESETLVRLSLARCRVDLRNQKVSCSKLKSLNLRRVCIEGDNIWDIIFMCPSIEELALCECTCSYRMLVLKPANMCVDDRYDFHKLKVLLLEKLEIGEWFFSHISRFPCLKELALNKCTGYEEVQICSNSIECISFSSTDHLSILRFEFDFPRIRKFKFSGHCVPSLSLKTVSKRWESDIFIRCVLNFHVLKTSWFHKLREFISELNSSKIWLSLHTTIDPPFLNTSIPSEEGHDYDKDIISLHKLPIVEKLVLEICAPSPVRSAVLEEIFWNCRPNFIALVHVPSLEIVDHERITETILVCAKRIADADMLLGRQKDSAVKCALYAMKILEKMVSIMGDYFQRMGAYILEGLKFKIKNMGYPIEGLNTYEISPSDLTSCNNLRYQFFPIKKCGQMFTDIVIGQAMSAERKIHIIDMRIGKGKRWVPFIQSLSIRQGGPPHLRITGLDISAPNGGVDGVGKILTEVAKDYLVPFEFATSVEIREGEAVAVNMTDAMSMCWDEHILSKVKEWSPKVVTLVEQESKSTAVDFTKQCNKTIDYYSAAFECIEGAGLEEEARRKLEQYWLGGEIMDIVGCDQRVFKHQMLSKWEKTFSAKGLSIMQVGPAVEVAMMRILDEYSEDYSISKDSSGALFVRWKFGRLTSHSAWVIMD